MQSKSRDVPPPRQLIGPDVTLTSLHWDLRHADWPRIYVAYLGCFNLNDRTRISVPVLRGGGGMRFFTQTNEREELFVAIEKIFSKHNTPSYNRTRIYFWAPMRPPQKNLEKTLSLQFINASRATTSSYKNSCH